MSTLPYYKKKASNNISNKTATPSFLPAKTLTSDQIKKTLLFFDLDPKYGPAYGLTRRERFNRAKKLGLEPSDEILRFIEMDSDSAVWANHFC